MELKLQSDEIDKLTSAFVQAQKQFKPISEDGKSHFGRYITLPEIRSVTREALLNNGLSLTQGRTIGQGGAVLLLFTKLTHVSGQWQISYAPLIVETPEKNGRLTCQQLIGVAMTYTRRYELYALFGFYGEDLDDDSISAPQNVNKATPVKDWSNYPVKDFHIKDLRALFSAAQKPLEIENLYIKRYGIRRLEDLKQYQCEEIIEELT